MAVVRGVPLNTPDMLVCSSVHFMSIVLDTFSPLIFQFLTPKPKQWCNNVLTPLLNDHTLAHANPDIESEIHLADATVVVIGMPLTLATMLVTPNITH